MNKKLEEQIEGAIDAMIAARKIMDRLQTRNELLEKVVEYAEHKAWCESLYKGMRPAGDCDCYYEQTLAALKEQA